VRSHEWLCFHGGDEATNGVGEGNEMRVITRNGFLCVHTHLYLNLVCYREEKKQDVAVNLVPTLLSTRLES
jgi:hypothetical protein